MIMTPEKAVVASIIICLAGAVLTLLVSRSKTLAGWLAFLFTATTSGLIFYAVWQVLIFGPSPHAAAFWAMPKIGFALSVYVDGLTAIFLTVAALIALPASFYSITYMRHYKEYGVARYYPYFLVFLAAMYGLLSTTDMMWFFFIFWQMMTWPGYALIRYEWKKKENIRAANKYLIMMQIACAATMIGAELLAIAGMSASHFSVKYDFEAADDAGLRTRRRRACLRPLPRRLRNQDGHVALRSNLAARCASRRAFTRQRHAFWRDDQDRRLRTNSLFPVARTCKRRG
jgi:NADH:ubiquinone oxidoreductase subunit 5 (subunit L)/multisubunit Na+/H+ antiporter MnhA subunit